MMDIPNLVVVIVALGCFMCPRLAVVMLWLILALGVPPL